MHHGPLIAILVAGLGLAFVFGAPCPETPHLAAGRLSARRRRRRALHAGLRRRSEPRRRAGRDRRHPADVRRRPAFLAARICCRSRRSPCPAPSCRSPSRRCSASALALAARLDHRRRAGLRPGAVGRQHRRAAARPAGTRIVETERGRIAVGWLIVEDLAMVLALVLLPALRRRAERRAARRPTPLSEQFDLGLWRRARHHPGQGRRLRRLHAGRRAARHPVGPALRRPYRLARAVPAGRARHGARRRLRRGGAVRRLLRARRLLRRHDPGESRRSASAPRRKRCRCATPSRCCSSSPSACCSTRRSCCASRWPLLATLADHRLSASRSPPSLIVRAFGQSDADRADDLGQRWRRSASSPSSWPGSASRWTLLPPEGPRPDPGRRDPLDPAQPVAVCPGRPLRRRGRPAKPKPPTRGPGRARAGRRSPIRHRADRSRRSQRRRRLRPRRLPGRRRAAGARRHGAGLRGAGRRGRGRQARRRRARASATRPTRGAGRRRARVAPAALRHHPRELRGRAGLRAGAPPTRPCRSSPAPIPTRRWRIWTKCGATLTIMGEAEIARAMLALCVAPEPPREEPQPA